MFENKIRPVNINLDQKLQQFFVMLGTMVKRKACLTVSISFRRGLKTTGLLDLSCLAFRLRNPLPTVPTRAVSVPKEEELANCDVLATQSIVIRSLWGRRNRGGPERTHRL